MSEYISLEKYNTYRINAVAKHVYFPSSESEVIEIAKSTINYFF